MTRWSDYDGQWSPTRIQDVWVNHDVHTYDMMLTVVATHDHEDAIWPLQDLLDKYHCWVDDDPMIILPMADDVRAGDQWSVHITRSSIAFDGVKDTTALEDLIGLRTWFNKRFSSYEDDHGQIIIEEE